MPPNERPVHDPEIASRDEIHAPPAKRKRRGLITVVVLLAAAAVGGWYYWTSTSSPAEQATKGRGRGGDPARSIPVAAEAAKKGNIDVYLNALGTVTPRNMVVVRSRVDGQLLRVAFKEGQMVKAGDLLAEVDPRPFQVQLTQATGQMAKDAALLKNAQIDLERYRTLLAQDSIARQQVDTQESLVRQYQGAIQADQGQIDSARLQLTYSRVTAPISGRVGLRQVDPGNIVKASDANGLVLIAQVQPSTVVFPIPEDNVPLVTKRMQAGEPLVVEAYDRDQKAKLATGKLLTIDNQIDTATGTVKLKAEFPNTDEALFPNQFVNVRMIVETRPDATLVPTPAIQRGAPGTFVYMVKDGRTVAVVPVKLGPTQGEVTSVESGVAPGDMVVVDGTDKLREGARVELITRDAQAAPAPGGIGRRGQDKGEGQGKGDRGEGKGDPPAGGATPGGRQQRKQGAE